MDVRKMACVAAAGFVGSMLVSAVTTSPVYARPNEQRELVVRGERIDPSLQRRVSYADLNLVYAAAQKTLRQRISTTATSLCFEINEGFDEAGECRSFAISGTKPQVAAAIQRAELRMAGKAVGPDVAISMVIMAH